jgi:hypothetical protein
MTPPKSSTTLLLSTAATVVVGSTLVYAYRREKAFREDKDNKDASAQSDREEDRIVLRVRGVTSGWRDDTAAQEQEQEGLNESESCRAVSLARDEPQVQVVVRGVSSPAAASKRPPTPLSDISNLAQQQQQQEPPCSKGAKPRPQNSKRKIFGSPVTSRYIQQ